MSLGASLEPTGAGGKGRRSDAAPLNTICLIGASERGMRGAAVGHTIHKTTGSSKTHTSDKHAAPDFWMIKTIIM